MKPEFDLKKEFCNMSISISFGNPIDGRCLLFMKLCSLNGLVFTPSSYLAFSTSSKVFQFGFPFDITDLETFATTTKQMNLAQHSEGFVLKLKASKRSGDESIRLLSMAIEKFKAGLESNSNNKVTLRNLADSYMYLELFELADFYFKAALSTDPKDTNSLFKYACFNERFGKLDLAEEYYLGSLTNDYSHSNCLTVYADFLASARKNYDESERFYLCGIESDKYNSFALNNYACFLSTIRHNYKKAEEFFKKAVEINPSPLHLQNIATFYKEIMKNPEETEKYLKQKELAEKKLLVRSFSFEDEDDALKNAKKQNEAQQALTRAQKRNLRRKKVKLALREKSDQPGGAYHTKPEGNQNSSGSSNASDEEEEATAEVTPEDFFIPKELIRKFKKKDRDLLQQEDRHLKRRSSDYFLDDYYL